MKIVIVGGSRGVGKAAVERAVLFGHEVTAFARTAPTTGDQLPGVEYVRGDAQNPHDIANCVIGKDAVLCTLGADDRSATTLYSEAARNLVAAMETRQSRRLIFLSNFGVLDETSFHPLTALLTAVTRLAIKSTLADHRRALDLLRKSKLDWTAVRPMALTDGAAQSNYRISEKGLPAGGVRISRADVADFMLRQLESSTFIGQAPALAY